MVLFGGSILLLCWGSYGLECVRFLSPKGIWRALYVVAFGLCILLGVRTSNEVVWNIGDFGIATMTFINLIALFFLRREIREETFRFAKREKKKDATPI